MLEKPRYRSLKSITESILSLQTWHALRTHALWQLGWTLSRNSKKSVNQFGTLPWWTYSLTHFLDQCIPAEWSVLEIGGGGSTRWWSVRGNAVTVIETSEEWAQDIARNAGTGGEVEVRLVDAISPDTLTRVLGDEKFDIVINDGEGDRSLIADVLADRLTDRGMLIWDNSDRPEYETGMQRLVDRGFQRLDFIGLTPIVAYAPQSTLFVRGPIGIQGRTVELPTIPN